MLKMKTLNEKAKAVCEENYAKNCGSCPIRPQCVARIGAGVEAMNTWIDSVNAAAENVRTAQTVEINSKLQIVKLSGQRFKVEGGYSIPKGYAFFHPELGYFAFDGELPYRPRGGKQVLQEILDTGGLLDFAGCKWIKEMRS
ncbi:hypothetical protein AB6A23_11120 [Paenibacillus tarimensis]